MKHKSISSTGLVLLSDRKSTICLNFRKLGPLSPNDHLTFSYFVLSFQMTHLVILSNTETGQSRRTELSSILLLHFLLAAVTSCLPGSYLPSLSPSQIGAFQDATATTQTRDLSVPAARHGRFFRAFVLIRHWIFINSNDIILASIVLHLQLESFCIENKCVSVM